MGDSADSKSIYTLTKGHKLVHNGGFPKFEELYCSLNIVLNLIYEVQSSKSQNFR